MESKGEEICTIYKNSVTLPVDVTSILNSVWIDDSGEIMLYKFVVMSLNFNAR